MEIGSCVSSPEVAPVKSYYSSVRSTKNTESRAKQIARIVDDFLSNLTVDTGSRYDEEEQDGGQNDPLTLNRNIDDFLVNTN